MVTLFAHRGYSSLYPENTMLSFEKAVESGSDGIELDVHLSKDGEVMIIHDEELLRTTGKEGCISDYSRSELEKISAGKTKEDRFGFTPIPSLEEYLSFAKDKKIVTNIELKTLPCYYNQLEEKVIALVEMFSLNDRIIYSSFNPLSAVHLKNISPESEIALLLEAFLPENYSYILSKTGFSFFHPSISLISERLINEMHEHSIGVNVWTVDGEENIGRCISLGVDGIISNDVVSSRAILASHEKNTEK